MLTLGTLVARMCLWPGILCEYRSDSNDMKSLEPDDGPELKSAFGTTAWACLFNRVVAALHESSVGAPIRVVGSLCRHPVQLRAEYIALHVLPVIEACRRIRLKDRTYIFLAHWAENPRFNFIVCHESPFTSALLNLAVFRLKLKPSRSPVTV